MTSSFRIAGIVPASGLSTRVGTAKALLDAGGKTFLERVTSALLQGGCDPVVVVVRDLHGPIAAKATGAGAVVVHNPDPEDGPISSIRCALRAWGSEVDGCAVCPVDHPMIDAGTVASLVESFRRTGPRVLIPTFDGRRGHPTLFHGSLFPELFEDGLEDGARTVVRRHAALVQEHPVSDEGVVVDIDTLPEYRRRFPHAYRRCFQSR